MLTIYLSFQLFLFESKLIEVSSYLNGKLMTTLNLLDKQFSSLSNSPAFTTSKDSQLLISLTYLACFFSTIWSINFLWTPNAWWKIRTWLIITLPFVTVLWKERKLLTDQIIAYYSWTPNVHIIPIGLPLCYLEKFIKSAYLVCNYFCRTLQS